MTIDKKHVLQKIVDSQLASYKNGTDSYMDGISNGLLIALAMFSGEDPELITPPKTLESNFKNQKNYINNYLASTYGEDVLIPCRPGKKVEMLNLMLTGLADEIAEIRNEIPWKPWKSGYLDPNIIDVEALKEEVVDASHFLNQIIMLAFDSLEEHNEVFARKLQINIDRQKEGY